MTTGAATATSRRVVVVTLSCNVYGYEMLPSYKLKGCLIGWSLENPAPTPAVALEIVSMMLEDHYIEQRMHVGRCSQYYDPVSHI